MSKFLSVVAVVVALTCGTLANAGSITPRVKADTVRAHTTDIYEVVFLAGEPAVVAVSGDGDTDLDLIVEDELGRVVASDLGFGDDCLVRFFPSRTQVYTIKVKNRGSVYNRYTIGHN